MAGTIVVRRAVKRDPKKIYFVDAEGNVRSAPRRTGGGKRGHRVCYQPGKRSTKKRSTKKKQ